MGGNHAETTKIKSCVLETPVILMPGDSQTVICKPWFREFLNKELKMGVQSRSARNSLKSPFFKSPLIRPVDGHEAH